MSLPNPALNPAVSAALAPTGVLRLGLVEAPTAGLVFVSRGADGTPEGVNAAGPLPGSGGGF